MCTCIIYGHTYCVYCSGIDYLLLSKISEGKALEAEQRLKGIDSVQVCVFIILV